MIHEIVTAGSAGRWVLGDAVGQAAAVRRPGRHGPHAHVGCQPRARGSAHGPFLGKTHRSKAGLSSGGWPAGDAAWTTAARALPSGFQDRPGVHTQSLAVRTGAKLASTWRLPVKQVQHAHFARRGIGQQTCRWATGRRRGPTRRIRRRCRWRVMPAGAAGRGQQPQVVVGLPAGRARRGLPGAEEQAVAAPFGVEHVRLLQRERLVGGQERIHQPQRVDAAGPRHGPAGEGQVAPGGRQGKDPAVQVAAEGHGALVARAAADRPGVAAGKIDQRAGDGDRLPGCPGCPPAAPR